MTSNFHPAPGQIIAGQFRLEQKLGEGGMGELYLATQLEVERPVVVKFVHAHVALERPESASRLRREAQAIAQVNHPNVVQLYSFGHEHGQAYLVMEYVAGVTLAKELEQGGAMPAARAVHISLQIAAGLSAAHQCGIVHRDLKPDNVMLTTLGGESDVVKLVDFGIAKLAETQGNKLTRTGLVVGTPQYMSPEQIEANVVDERSDLYCFGLILYEMLTGTCTFTGSTPYELLTAHVKGQVVPPSRYVRSVSPALEGIVLRCLQKEPSSRFESAQALRAALQVALLSATTAPRPAYVPETQDLPPPPASRRPVAAAASTPPAQRFHGTEASSGGGRWPRWAPGLAIVAAVSVAGLTVFRDKLPSLRRDPQQAALADTPTPATAGSAPAQPDTNASDWAATPPTAPAPEAPLARGSRAKQVTDAVNCLNEAADRGYESYYRYDSWVDLEAGPSLRGNIYGLYTLSADDCPTAPSAGPDKELAKRLDAYATAIHTLDTLTKKADRYYEQEDYKDDQMAEGQRMHAPLVAAFRAFADSEKSLRKLLLQRRRAADEALIASLAPEDAERTFHELRLAAYDLYSQGLCSPKCMREISTERFRAALAAFSSKLEQLEKLDKENRLNGPGAELLEDAKKFARHLGSSPGWSSGDRMNLDDPLAGWMVDGSPYSLERMAASFVEDGNRAEVMETRELVDVTPLIPYPAPDKL